MQDRTGADTGTGSQTATDTALNDCFAFDQKMISTEQALAHIAAIKFSLPDIATARLNDALGRTLAEDVISPLNIPSWRDFPLRRRLIDLTDLPVYGDLVNFRCIHEIINYGLWATFGNRDEFKGN